MSGNLHFRFTWIHCQGKGQGDERRQQPFSFFFLQFPASTLIYTLSLHDALPICGSLCLTFFRARREILEHLRYTFVEVLFIFSASSGSGPWTTPRQISFVFSSYKWFILCKAALL